MLTDSVIVISDLQTRADNIRRCLARSIQAIAAAGLELIEAEKECRHGEWENFCRVMVGISPSTALRYRKVTEMLLEYVPVSQLENLQAEPSALYALINGQLPDEARHKAIDYLLAGQFLTGAIVSGMVKEVERKMEQVELLQYVQNPEVTELVLRHDVDPDIIPGLTRLDSESIQALAASGAIEDLEGNSLPLTDVTVRDMTYYEDKNHLERYLSGKRGPTCVPCNQSMTLLTAGEREELDGQKYLVDQYECIECGHVVSVNHRRVNK